MFGGCGGCVKLEELGAGFDYFRVDLREPLGGVVSWWRGGGCGVAVCCAVRCVVGGIEGGETNVAEATAALTSR